MQTCLRKEGTEALIWVSGLALLGEVSIRLKDIVLTQFEYG